MYIRPETIEELHVETTNKCNAACPMCDRNIHGGVDRPGRGLSEWSLEDIKKVFMGLPNLKFVYFCGTHGEPLASKNIFEAIKAAKDTGARIEMFTNGSLKPNSWWEKLISILDKKDRITFGVDGIETNHLYRQNTDVDKILQHMQICCDSDVQVRWDFLVFKHNEHEMEKCKQLAKDMGVQHFRFRRTARFDRHIKFPVFDKNFNLTHYLEPPENPKWRHPGIKDMEMILDDLRLIGKRRADMTDFEWVDGKLPDSWKINCLYQESKKIYVNNRLEVFPCCYISDTFETYKSLSSQQLKYPLGELSLRNKTWQDILNHKYFAEDLEKSWKQQNVHPRCIITCSKVKREKEQNVKVNL
tara:strand:- start:96 stop:1169 length:1074 start_codon:yes stop_codon:yes gene_type:complete